MADPAILLAGDRLRLRQFFEADREAMIAYYGNPAVMAIRKFGVRARAAASAAFDAILADWQAHGFGLFAAEQLPRGAFMGECGLRRIDDGEVELSYGLLPAFRGRGHATAGARLALAYGFETLELQRIVALSRGDNLASHRVLEKCGMRLLWRHGEGLYGLVKYEIARGDWQGLGGG